MSFFISEDEKYTKEVRYKILVYPNITKVNNLEKDSYVVVLRQVIKYIHSHYTDVHFTIVTPPGVKYADGVDMLICDFPEHPNAMRNHFDLITFEKRINHRANDYDIIYSHLPEHTLQLSNYFKNHTGLRPKIVGYCHWYEVEENDAPSVNTFDTNILGTLQMEECGVNSTWLKNLVIDRAAKTFNERTLNKLKKIIQPHRLGTDIDLNGSEKELPRSILFNHRSDGYTGWKRFLKLMDKLWEGRKDFKVYMTFPTEDSRDYLVKKTLDNKEDYYNFIKQMTVGVCMFDDYSAWSLSTTDGLSRGIPYLMPKKLCYPEMVGDNCSLFYNNDDQFLVKLVECLDNTEFKKQKKEELEKIATNLSWDSSIGKWFDGWKIFDPNTFVVYQNSQTYEKEIIPFLRDKGKATKAEFLKHFGWGYNVDFGKYRNMLRLDDRVKMFVDRYEFVG